MDVTQEEKKTLSSFPRLCRLHEALLAAKKGVCIERARYLTQHMKSPEAWFEPAAIRRAKAVGHILRNLKVSVYPDELLIGALTGKRVGAIVYPEFIGLLIWPELRELGNREIDPLEITGEEIEELDQQVFPFWQGKVVADYADRYTSPPAPISLLEKFGFFLLTEAGGISHTAPDFEKLLDLGLNGVIKESRQRIEEIDGALAADPEALEKRSFYLAVQTACEAVIEFARRYSRESLRIAEAESDPVRKAELRELARICEKVPAAPPDTFHEALQSIWLVELALHQENYEQALCLGRLDQYLYPYYRQDIENGSLTDDRAIELLGCLFIKLSEFVPLFGENIAMFFSGFPANPAITVGGLTLHGRDATNELTYLILETRRMLMTRHPNIHARVHRESPRQYLDMVAEVVKTGCGMPAVVNDEVILPALMEKGIREEDARDNVVIGCVEISVPRKTFGSTDAALMSLPICLEMALNNGYSPVMLEHVGPGTGDPGEFKSMDDVVKAFTAQVSYLVKQMVAGLNALGIAHRDLYPSPLLSSLIQGCMEKGKDVTAGGAVYNFTGVQGVGVADVADSLAALDLLVFREKQVSMEELLQALENDFEGYDELHNAVLRLPKYGNDEELPDSYAAKVVEIFCREVSRHWNIRGGPYLPGFLTMTTHKGFGKFVGALPSGRKAFETFANGLSPYDGWDRKGPTACLKSISRLNHHLAANGVSVNLMLSPENLKGSKGNQVLGSLVRTYFDLGGMHLQFNVVDKQKLVEAQERPEKYPALAVRVAGYSAYFVDLTREVQDEIIARTQHGCA